MQINIKSIPHDQQRYPTIGDWWWDEDWTLQIRVSEGGNDEFLVAIHELVEAWLCHERGITDQQVTDFDTHYIGSGEPGDHVSAPYRREHRFAMIIEHMMAHELGIQGYGTII